MESSTFSLIYKGSISEAIIEAKKQKKIFLVYISGEDENSANLVNSTWADERVAESVSRYCIFLHLIEGHVEASQFSDIYPQKSIPSISAVGYNGVMLWQHEGYINVESFVESIAKAWAAMNFQDTAAAFLTAAIATKKPEPSSSVSADVAPIEQGESYSSLHDPLPSADDHAQNLEAGPSNDPQPLMKQKQEDISNEDNKLLQLHTANAVKTHREDTAIKERETVEILHSVTQIIPNSEVAPLENVSHENHSKSSPEPAGEINLCSPQSSQINAIDVHEGEEAVANVLIGKKNAIKSTDIHLSIRMPSGASLLAKFIASDRLRSVKNYVDDNNGSMISPYDLAIPYPRKVFGEEDMNKSLAELGFTGRQVVIVIPKRQAPGLQRGVLPNDIQTSANQTNSNDSALGYFVYLKRVLSYMNPFSYLSGSRSESSTSEQAPNDGLWQYRPNPGLQNSLLGRETGRSSPYPSNAQNSATGGNASISGRTSRPFGSNIHTLREDGDDFRSDDRNVFWNGNSTQFGGNDK